jgi:hypothetical protein
MPGFILTHKKAIDFPGKKYGKYQWPLAIQIIG